MARPRAFRLEDLFSNNGVPGGDPSDPSNPGGTPTPEPDPIQIQVPQPGGLPGPAPGDGSGILDPSAPSPMPRGGPESQPLPASLPEAPGASAPGFPPLAPAASPTSATAPGSFANPGSSAARPLQPFNYRSLFDSRNQTQGSLIPGARVPTTPANIAPESGAPTGGQSESAITRALRRMRG